MKKVEKKIRANGIQVPRMLSNIAKLRRITNATTVESIRMTKAVNPAAVERGGV
jgi:hypothetical protein